MASKESLNKAAEAERHKRLALEQEKVIQDAIRRRDHHLENSRYTPPEEIFGVIGGIVIFIGIGALALSLF